MTTVNHTNNTVHVTKGERDVARIFLAYDNDPEVRKAAEDLLEAMRKHQEVAFMVDWWHNTKKGGK